MVSPNHPILSYFTNNPPQLHRFVHYSDEIQVSDLKINNQLGYDIDIINAQEEKGGNIHKRGMID